MQNLLVAEFILVLSIWYTWKERFSWNI